MAYDDFEDKSFRVDDDYFKVVIPDLDPGKTVPIQLRWQYEDKTYGDWSASYKLEVPLRDRPKPTNILAVWDGTNLKITWNASELATGFVIVLTGDAGLGSRSVEFFRGAVSGQTSYEIVISESEIRSSFNNVFLTTLTGTLIANYADFQTDPQPFTIPAYVDGLTGTAISDASWSITAVDDGSIVAWDKITNSLYLETEVWRSDTQNGTYFGAGGATNAPVKVSHISDIWIKIRHRTKSNTYTQFSNPKQASRYDPVFEDILPPNDVTINSVNWSGNDLLINYTMPATNPGNRARVRLEAFDVEENVTKIGFFNQDFPSSTGTHVFKITDNEIFREIDDRFTSYNGRFISIDFAGNASTGTVFNTGLLANPGQGIPATFTVIPITNGYTVTWTPPSWVIRTKIWEGTTAGFTPNDATNLVYTGTSPAIIKTLGRPNPYARKYIRIQWFGNINGHQSDISAEDFVDPIDALTADITAPNAPATASATAGLDSSGTIGFNGFINLSWSAVSDTTLRGYRIRFRPFKATAPFENYSYVDSPGTGTTYRLHGLAAGATYEVAIASYDEYNNTSSSYTAISPNPQVLGSPFIGTNISTTGFFEAGVAGTDTGTFKFGYGVETGKRGIVFNPNNYWYINSSQSAEFKLGGSTSNYVLWNGQKLDIDGDLGVAGGTTIGGNISMKNTGASIYAGTLTQGGALNSDGFLLNSGGLAARKTFIVNGQPVTKEARLQVNDGIYADYGLIAGWTIDTDRIERGTGAFGNKYAGLSASGTYAFWAGSDSSRGDANAKFLVTPGGAVTAREISIINGGAPTAKIIDAGPFFVRNDGYMEATNAKIRGNIEVDSGKVRGPLTIGSVNEPGGYLQVLAGNGFLEVGYGLTKSGSPYYGIQAGSISGQTRTNKFEVSALTGEMTAVGGGNIGGWTIGTTQLNAGTGASYVGISAGGSEAFWAGNATAASAPFRVTAAGALTATQATITGTIRATDGFIGGATTGWIITGTQLRSALNTDGSFGDLPGKTARVLLNGSTGVVSGATLSGGVVIGSAFYLGADTNATDKLLSDGTFTLGNGRLVYSGGNLTISNTIFTLGITSDENGTFGDTTVVQNNDTGRLTIGRALFYGGTVNPNTPTLITSRAQHNNGNQGTSQFRKGDLWLQRA